MSKSALWAQKGLPPTKSRNFGRISSTVGAPSSIWSVMPVSSMILGRSLRPGATGGLERIDDLIALHDGRADLDDRVSAGKKDPVVSRSKATCLRRRSLRQAFHGRRCGRPRRNRRSSPRSRRESSCSWPSASPIREASLRAAVVGNGDGALCPQLSARLMTFRSGPALGKTEVRASMEDMLV